MNLIDKQNRSIELKLDGTHIKAIHDDEVIGTFKYEELDHSDDYNYLVIHELYEMNIQSKYQRAGIGLKMLEFGESNFEKIVYPQDGTSNYPTIEGAGLLNAAIRKGIIKNPVPEEEIKEDDEPPFDWPD
jgi:hypothetical protein